MAFELHPALNSDTLFLTDLPVCRVLLMNDSRFPWLILVPRKSGLRDLVDLPPETDAALMGEVRQACAALTTRCNPDKLNVAALGNQVPQLHIHVIARRTDDSAWPGPVWGVGTRRPYGSPALEQTAGGIMKTLATGE